jgi:predicted nucleotidyltransferase
MRPAARHRAALRENTIAPLRAHFAEHPPRGAARVMVFGSLARGDFDGASDADLLILGRSSPDSAVEAAVGRAVEMFLWSPARWEPALAAAHPLATEVAREGLEIWAATP